MGKQEISHIGVNVWHMYCKKNPMYKNTKSSDILQLWIYGGITAHFVFNTCFFLSTNDMFPSQHIKEHTSKVR